MSPTLPEGDDYWIAPDANLIGSVTIESGVSIWFGATLRGDTEPLSVRAGSNTHENTVVHADPGFPVVIGADCTIGHKAMIHGCTIGDGSLVGMGATILNGAVIGRGCLIGAGALVTEGKVIPDGSLVMGMPGKVVRELSDEELQFLELSGKMYAQKGRMFAEKLKLAG